MFRALIVDDEPMALVSTLYSFDWKSRGFSQPVSASSGEEALRLLRSEPYDAAFVDIRMPGMTGLDLISTCVQETMGTVFVILSGYSDFSYVQSALRLSAVDYCLKPIEPDEGARTLDSAYRHVLKQRMKTDPDRLRTFPSRSAGNAPWQAMLIKTMNLLELMPYLSELSPDQCFLLDESTLFLIGPGLSDVAESLPDSAEFSCACCAIGSNPPSYQRIYQLLAERIDEPASRQRLMTVSLNAANDSFEPILEHIREHLSEPLSLLELSKQFHLNYTYLSELFTDLTGQPFTKYVNTLRMEKARRLIENSSMNLTEVSIDVGFSSYHHFSNLFKKQYGISPNRLRSGKEGADE